MAVARCKDHGRPLGRARKFNETPIVPIGYPDTAAVCGRAGCKNPALLWLEADEARAYANGQRVFLTSRYTAKFRTEDPPAAMPHASGSEAGEAPPACFSPHRQDMRVNHDEGAG